MEKGNEFTGFLKDKNINVKKEGTQETQVKRAPTLKEKAIIKAKNFYYNMKKAFQKGSKFGIFLFQVILFIGGPMYVQFYNMQLYYFFKANGGFRREGGSMAPGMRPY